MGDRTARLPAIIITAVLTAIIVGGGVYAWQHAKVMSQSAELHSVEIALDSALTDSYASSVTDSKEVNDLEQRIDDLESTVTLLREAPERVEVSPDLLKVYDALRGEDPRITVIGYLVPVNRRQPVLEKMKILADRVSRLSFAGLPVSILRIRTRNGRRIATIDLREVKGMDRSWARDFFQGSTGGGITMTRLIDTFLQKGYKAEWVDGIEFYYEGQPATPWDHIDLSGIFYR